MKLLFTINPFMFSAVKKRKEKEGANVEKQELLLSFRRIIKEKFGTYALKAIAKYVKINVKEKFAYNTEFVIIPQKPEVPSKAVILLKNLNCKKDLNGLFKAMNERLYEGGLFISQLKTFDFPYLKKLSKYPGTFRFVIKAKRFLFNILKLNSTNCKYSKAEILGRLVYTGFEILEEIQINNRLLIVAKKKTSTPKEEKKYGSVIQLKRIGKNGKKINVYKFRSMYPYSEYIQDYIYKKNDLKEGGKFKNDFRISKIGYFIRKTWIDELPMLYNIFRGDIKLFGVRPLSNHYYNLYPEELKVLRIKAKPGLIPPFYVDMPKTLDEIVESEIRYLKAYFEAPLKTDFIYFFKALNNIIIKGKRSN